MKRQYDDALYLVYNEHSKPVYSSWLKVLEAFKTAKKNIAQRK